ncbi:MAG: hypothetical protein HFH67_17875 [Lachnospiraceae bacterium]|nr:hypothetical protein [Lachnospiraceae bacterium]
MSTSCVIGLQEETGILATYCLNDGYLDIAGAKLYHFYSDEARLKELIKLGAIDSLGKTTEFITRAAVDALDREKGLKDILEDKCHSAELASDGSRRTIISTYDRRVLNLTEEDFWNYRPIMNVEYWYLYKDKQWFCDCYMHDVGKRMVLLLIDAYNREFNTGNCE